MSQGRNGSIHLKSAKASEKVPRTRSLGSEDKIVSENEVSKLAQRLALQKGIKIDYKKVNGADHFFEGKLDELTAAADKYIKASLVPVHARAGKGAQSSA